MPPTTIATSSSLEWATAVASLVSQPDSLRTCLRSCGRGSRTGRHPRARRMSSSYPITRHRSSFRALTPSSPFLNPTPQTVARAGLALPERAGRVGRCP